MQVIKWEEVLSLKNRVKNVLIFVSDSLRWDYLPEEVRNTGVTAKTVASSLFTASSFPSMVSGLYPPRHGVYTFTNRLPREFSGFYTFDDYNLSFWCETIWVGYPQKNTPLHKVLSSPPAVPLPELSPPFIYMENDKGGHCPYGRVFEVSDDRGCISFFRELIDYDQSDLKNKYQESVEITKERFFKRLDYLREKKLDKDTLVIYTSDHGELLGEYGGIIAHSRPACPEIVYVPTVFIHPDLPGGKLLPGIMRHVDLFPIIAYILDKNIHYETDGRVPLDKPIEYGFNFRMGGFIQSENKLLQKVRYNAWSIWWESGGYVFHKMNPMFSILKDIWKLFKKHPPFMYHIGLLKREPWGSKLRTLREFIYYQNASTIKFGEPPLKQSEALQLLDKYIKETEPLITPEDTTEEGMELLRENLKNLGYLD